jgi:hypothetical protein
VEGGLPGLGPQAKTAGGGIVSKVSRIGQGCPDLWVLGD